ncbi:MAG: O-antigen ligase family protein [Pyrinomonadaceae bacterium]
MTTSISSAEVSSLQEERSETPATQAVAPSVHRVPHTLASRFIFLNLCVAIVLSALAFGTVHSWAMALFSLGAFVTLVLWLVDGLRLGTLRISKNLLQVPLLGMLALGLVQLLPLRQADTGGVLTIPTTGTLSLDPYATRLVIVQVASLLIYFAATTVFTDTPHRLRLLVRTITIFGFFLAIFGLTQSIASPTRVYWVRELAQSTAFGPFINRHHFAGYMELTIGLPLGLIFGGALEKEKRFIYLFAAGLMGVALIMTGSRGGIISLIAEISFLLGLAGFRKRRRRTKEVKGSGVRRALVRTGLALVLIIGLFAGVVLLGGESALVRFLGTVNSDDPTTGRAHFWSVTLDIIKAHPVVGAGLGAFPSVYTRYDSRNGLYRLEQAHNDYLQILSDGGIVGAALGLFFVIALFRMGFSRRESRDEFRSGVALGALAGCFAVLVHSFFDFTLHITSNTLLFLVLAALATMNGRVEHVTSHRRRRRRTSEAAPIMIKP